MSQTMERLRSARPAPVHLHDDPDKLFSAIVGGPRETLPARRIGHRRTLVIACAVAVAVLTAGSAYAFTNIFGWHDATTLVSSPREWQRLYVAAQHELALPPGETWPARTLAPNTVTSRYQPGGEAVAIAQHSWECYWAHAIHTGDHTAQHQAHAALVQLVEHHIVVAPAGSSENVEPPASVKMPVETYADDGGLQYVKRMYALAAAGNPTLLAQSCRANG
jgi:hypothetical protein